MSWLTPIGFLGLLGLVVLIIIYIIKPNYQNKIISSTFVWKLSLKYKKNKIPISKLRNLLLFLCQILILTISAFILAQPFIDSDVINKTEKKVYIIDASASMMTEAGGITRFERAVEEVRADAKTALQKDDAEVSIIIAHDKASFLIERVDKKTAYLVDIELDELVADSETNPCTWGTPDVSGAIKLSERVTSTTPDVEVLFYTDSSYIDAGKVTIVPVRDINEWNAAILDVRAVLVENKYEISVDVGCYGAGNRDVPISVSIEGTDISGNPTFVDFTTYARCTDDATETIVFSADGDDETIASKIKTIASYRTIHVKHDESDSFASDDNFFLYGGEKLPLRIQYYSATPNNFFSSAMMVLRDRLKGRWDIEYKEVKANEEPKLEGFDVYIFEHATPEILPTDGVVILSNPSSTPVDGGYSLASHPSLYPEDQIVEAGEEHPITNMITASNITVTQYTTVSNYDLYTPLLMCNDDPILLVMNEPDAKVVVMPFSVNYSNLPVIMEFPLLMYNIIEYFIPSTVKEYVFDVGENISLNARGNELKVVGNSVNETYTEFPTELNLSTPGVYTLTQEFMGKDIPQETIFVKLSAEESNINSEFDEIANPYYLVEEENTSNKDLLLYFAMALVALLFCEWWLHTREYK